MWASEGEHNEKMAQETNVASSVEYTEGFFVPRAISSHRVVQVRCRDDERSEEWMEERLWFFVYWGKKRHTWEPFAACFQNDWYIQLTMRYLATMTKRRANEGISVGALHALQVKFRRVAAVGREGNDEEEEKTTEEEEEEEEEGGEEGGEEEEGEEEGRRGSRSSLQRGPGTITLLHGRESIFEFGRDDSHTPDYVRSFREVYGCLFWRVSEHPFYLC